MYAKFHLENLYLESILEIKTQIRGYYKNTCYGNML
jgi:hypothetical protein